jgi:hypothetical protein
LINPPLVVLPLHDEDQKGGNGKTATDAKRWALLTPEQLTEIGKLESAQWFAKGEKLWSDRRSDTARKQSMTANGRLDYQRGLTDQPAAARWAVIFNRSAKNGNACVFDVQSFNQRFIVDFAAYVHFAPSREEADYLCCYLNCDYVNAAIKAFQTSGLFGERDVTKKILELPWPAFSRANPWHRKLAALGRDAAALALQVVGPQQDMELGARDLGQLRLRVRRELAPLLAEIDRLVAAISTGQDLRWIADDWQRLVEAPGTPSNVQDADALSEILRDERNAWEHRELPKPSEAR